MKKILKLTELSKKEMGRVIGAANEPVQGPCEQCNCVCANQPGPASADNMTEDRQDSRADAFHHGFPG